MPFHCGFTRGSWFPESSSKSIGTSVAPLTWNVEVAEKCAAVLSYEDDVGLPFTLPAQLAPGETCRIDLSGRLVLRAKGLSKAFQTLECRVRSVLRGEVGILDFDWHDVPHSRLQTLSVDECQVMISRDADIELELHIGERRMRTAFRPSDWIDGATGRKREELLLDLDSGVWHTPSAQQR